MQTDLGKFFLVLGAVFLLVGLVLSLKIHIPWLGKLPGDINIKRDNFQFYFPLATCILISILLTLLLRLFRK
jgi:DUF2905 family protein